MYVLTINRKSLIGREMSIGNGMEWAYISSLGAIARLLLRQRGFLVTLKCIFIIVVARHSLGCPVTLLSAVCRTRTVEEGCDTAELGTELLMSNNAHVGGVVVLSQMAISV